MNQQEIKNFLHHIGATLFERYGIELAYLFGSANAGRFTTQSDIDIAVKFKPEGTPNDFFRLSGLLEAELSKALQRKIDVAILNLAPPLLRYEVVKNGSVLYARDDEQRILFHIRAHRDYEDFCHSQDFYIRALREKLLGVKA